VAIAPFLIYLLLIASLPLVFGQFWDNNRNKLVIAAVFALPVVIDLVGAGPEGTAQLVDAAREYLAFITLLAALFTIAGGIYVRGDLAGTPAVNTALLAVGAVLANLIGTTGASALLIRPVLRANEHRPHARHVVVFFIFIVANGGGLLTPLGDPPLFLGFLRGVPFTWTLGLALPWVVVNGALLVAFAVFDVVIARRDRAPRATPAVRARLGLDGKRNLVWLLGVIATVVVVGTYGHHSAAATTMQIVATVGLGALSMLTTPRRIHLANRLHWAPILEVAVVFAGIFITMVPALAFMQAHGASLGVTRPWGFFWASGALSSVLDNAPTYLTFASLATGVAGGRAAGLSAHDLGALAAHPAGGALLAAVSCGSVFMGAMTYIGNGPNFMVKAIAEQHHVRMPSFFGYLVWSGAILLPLMAGTALMVF
jgi:Na+/H+ antiporter NhaD/arsenite permease-like protein